MEKSGKEETGSAHTFTNNMVVDLILSFCEWLLTF